MRMNRSYSAADTPANASVSAADSEYAELFSGTSAHATSWPASAQSVESRRTKLTFSQYSLPPSVGRVLKGIVTSSSPPAGIPSGASSPCSRRMPSRYTHQWIARCFSETISYRLPIRKTPCSGCTGVTVTGSIAFLNSIKAGLGLRSGKSNPSMQKLPL
ncbi:hypothetical protein D3C85_1251160 [compost metagenome]